MIVMYDNRCGVEFARNFIEFLARESCGKCRACISGRPHQCEAVWARDTKSPYKNKKGQELFQTFKIGSFGEYTILDQSQCVPLPDVMPLDRASMLACGVTTGFGAVVWRAKVEVGSSCVVIGTGGVGLNAIQGAAISGAYPVIAVDVNDAKLEASKTFGATHTVNSAKEDPIEAVKKLTGGRGADYAFGTVGVMSALAQGVEMIGPRGWCVWVGLPEAGATMDLGAFQVIMPEKVITGSYMGSTNLQMDIPKLVDLYLAGKLKLDELITKRYELEDINEAIETVVQGKALRNIIMFE